MTTVAVTVRIARFWRYQLLNTVLPVRVRMLLPVARTMYCTLCSWCHWQGRGREGGETVQGGLVKVCTTAQAGACCSPRALKAKLLFSSVRWHAPAAMSGGLRGGAGQPACRSLVCSPGPAVATSTHHN